jgi:hypothetical protein
LVTSRTKVARNDVGVVGPAAEEVAQLFPRLELVARLALGVASFLAGLALAVRALARIGEVGAARQGEVVVVLDVVQTGLIGQVCRGGTDVVVVIVPFARAG